MKRLILVLPLLLSICEGNVLKIKLGNRLYQANFDSYKADEAYEINLTPKEIVEADYIEFPNGDVLKKEYQPFRDGNFATYEFATEGQVSSLKAANEADITINIKGQDVTGQVKGNDGVTYAIVHLDGTRHAWIKVKRASSEFKDMSIDLGRDHSRSWRPEMKASDKALLAMGRQSTDVTPISVKIYYTRAYKDYTRNLKGDIESTIGVTNNGFRQSGVKIRLVLHCTELYTGPEPSDAIKYLEAFSKHKGSYEATLGSADTALLLAGKLPGVGGIAYVGNNPPFGLADNREYKFQFIFAHELAHILSGGHDDETIQQQGQPPKVQYGRATRIAGTKKYTILAYPSYQYSENINYYSGPNVYDNQGSRTGDANHDNARVLNEWRFKVAANGDESKSCPYDPNLGGDGGGAIPPPPSPQPPYPPPPPPPSTCQDVYSNCNVYAAYCVQYDQIRQACPKTCNAC